MTMKLTNKSLANLAIIFLFAVIPLMSFAQGSVVNEDDISGTPCNISGKICNPIHEDTITGFLKTVLEAVLKLGIPVVALAVIYSGFLFVKARGNPEEITKAKDALLYTLIGAAILLGSWAIAELISSTVRSL